MALRKETLISYVATDLTRTVSPILMLPTKICTKFLYQALDSQHFFARSKPTYSRLTGLPWSSDGLEIVERPPPVTSRSVRSLLRWNLSEDTSRTSSLYRMLKPLGVSGGLNPCHTSCHLQLYSLTLVQGLDVESSSMILEVSFCNLDTTYPNHEKKLVI